MEYVDRTIEFLEEHRDLILNIVDQSGESPRGND